MFFGGRSIVELAVSFVIGIITGVISTNKSGLNKILVKFTCSLIACLIVFALGKLGVIKHADYIFIANIMTLIPGIGLTNALRDLFVGDSISGVLRLIEAAMLAVAIASGYMAASFIFGGVA